MFEYQNHEGCLLDVLTIYDWLLCLAAERNFTKIIETRLR
jgi:hypothetical protein